MKKVFKSLMLMLVVLMLGACGGKTEEKETVVSVGTNAEFAPFEYLDKDKIVGFDIELMEAISKEAGFKVEIKDMAFDGLLPALQMKKVDLVIAGMTATPEREKTVLFSNPYFKAKQVIITKKDDKSLTKFDDLAGKKVGVMLGFTGDAIVSEIKGAEVERFNAAYVAIGALAEDKLDAVVLDSEPAKKYIETNEELVIADVPAEEEDYAIAVRKDDEVLAEKINKALETIKANGEYDKILKKYFK
ncbi:MAG: basic amino acid ABC transporter substrate-binding protein [Fusobacterium sp.]|nr:basic amino acid ABC transporter substrate-binding protein [Fusobacterium sp.]